MKDALWELEEQQACETNNDMSQDIAKKIELENFRLRRFAKIHMWLHGVENYLDEIFAEIVENNEDDLIAKDK